MPTAAAAASFAPDDQLVPAKYFSSRTDAEKIGPAKIASIMKAPLQKQAANPQSPLQGVKLDPGAASVETRNGRRYVAHIRRRRVPTPIGGRRSACDGHALTPRRASPCPSSPKPGRWRSSGAWTRARWSAAVYRSGSSRCRREGRGRRGVGALRRAALFGVVVDCARACLAVVWGPGYSRARSAARFPQVTPICTTAGARHRGRAARSAHAFRASSAPRVFLRACAVASKSAHSRRIRPHLKREFITFAKNAWCHGHRSCISELAFQSAST